MTKHLETFQQLGLRELLVDIVQHRRPDPAILRIDLSQLRCRLSHRRIRPPHRAKVV